MPKGPNQRRVLAPRDKKPRVLVLCWRRVPEKFHSADDRRQTSHGFVRRKIFFSFDTFFFKRNSFSSYPRNTQGEIRSVFMFQYCFKTLRLAGVCTIHTYVPESLLFSPCLNFFFRKMSLKVFASTETFFFSLRQKFPVEEIQAETPTYVSAGQRVVLKHNMRSMRETGEVFSLSFPVSFSVKIHSTSSVYFSSIIDD